MIIIIIIMSIYFVVQSKSAQYRRASFSQRTTTTIHRGRRRTKTLELSLYIVDTFLLPSHLVHQSALAHPRDAHMHTCIWVFV